MYSKLYALQSAYITLQITSEWLSPVPPVPIATCNCKQINLNDFSLLAQWPSLAVVLTGGGIKQVLPCVSPLCLPGPAPDLGNSKALSSFSLPKIWRNLGQIPSISDRHLVSLYLSFFIWCKLGKLISFKLLVWSSIKSLDLIFSMESWVWSDMIKWTS